MGTYEDDAIMTIHKSKQGNVATVTLVGRMDADWSAEFEKACTELATGADGATHLIVDLTGLTYASSMGLRAFLAVAKARQAAGGELILVGLAGFVKQVFDMTRITALFRTAESVPGALEALA
jgi:anti-anti-sigma factor